MNLTVHVTHQQKERVVQEARIRNLNPQQFFDQLLEDALQRLSHQPISPAAAEDSWEVKLRAIGVDTGVSLANEATRRECIYEG